MDQNIAEYCSIDSNSDRAVCKYLKSLGPGGLADKLGLNYDDQDKQFKLPSPQTLPTVSTISFPKPNTMDLTEAQIIKANLVNSASVGNSENLTEAQLLKRS